MKIKLFSVSAASIIVITALSCGANPASAQAAQLNGQQNRTQAVQVSRQNNDIGGNIGKSPADDAIRATSNPGDIAHYIAPKIQLPPMTPSNSASYRYYYNILLVGEKNLITKTQAINAIGENQVMAIIASKNENKPIALLYKNGSAYGTGFDMSVLTAAYEDSGVPIVLLEGQSLLGSIFGAGLLGIFTIMNQAILAAVMLIIGVSMLRRFGGSRAVRLKPSIQKVRFTDIAGLREAKEELTEIIDFLKNPERYAKMGARVPAGVLLEGPPGNGKTLLARAISCEANVPFYALNASDVIDSFISVAAGRVRKAFGLLRRKPSRLRLLARLSQIKRSGGIIFIDEIDLITQRRGGSSGTDLQKEREHILTQLLVELDGVKHPKDPRHPIILIGATNRADTMDPAILRPGRIDRRIRIGNPDANDRVEAFKIHLRDKNIESDIDFRALSEMTSGMSGADIANLANEAAMYAIRNRFDYIDQECFERSILRVVAGLPQPNKKISPEQKRVIAYHEAGHAVAAYILPDADNPIWATMIPHGNALGLVMMSPKEDEYIVSRKRLISKTMVCMAGRAAELEFFGTEMATSGAAQDRVEALNLIRAMTGEFGLGDQARFIGSTPKNGGFEQTVSMSEYAKAMFDQSIETEFGKIEMETADLIRENKRAVVRLAEAMLNQKTLNRSQIEDLIVNDGSFVNNCGRLRIAAASSDCSKDI